VHFLQTLLSSQNHNQSEKSVTSKYNLNSFSLEHVEQEHLLLKSKCDALLEENQRLLSAVQKLQEERGQDAESGFWTHQEIKRKLFVQQVVQLMQ
jgi:hypothetical protein